MASAPSLRPYYRSRRPEHEVIIPTDNDNLDGLNFIAGNVSTK